LPCYWCSAYGSRGQICFSKQNQRFSLKCRHLSWSAGTKGSETKGVKSYFYRVARKREGENFGFVFYTHKYFIRSLAFFLCESKIRCPYKLSLHKKSNIIQNMSKNVNIFITSTFYSRAFVKQDNNMTHYLRLCK
jgi:hypothetical protein